MKRMVLAVLAVACLAGAGSLAAQQGVRVGVGGGLLIPMGDYKNSDKMGWVVGGDVTYWLTSTPIGIRADLQYSQTSEKSGFPAHTSKIIGGLAEIVYAFGTQADPIRPYVMGGIGFFNFKASAGGLSASESKVGFGGGAGVAFKVGTGGTRLFVEGKFVSVQTSGSSATFLPIRAGLRFGGGR